MPLRVHSVSGAAVFDFGIGIEIKATDQLAGLLTRGINKTIEAPETEDSGIVVS